jgi:hypothetical protein
MSRAAVRDGTPERFCVHLVTIHGMRMRSAATISRLVGRPCVLLRTAIVDDYGPRLTPGQTIDAQRRHP